MKVKSDRHSKFSNLSNGKKKPEKIRASTGFEPVTSAIPMRCSTNWAMKPHIGSEVKLLSSDLPVRWNDVKFIWNNWYLYCGCRWKWRVIIVVNFPISGFFFPMQAFSFHCDDHSSLSSTTTVQIWIISYKLHIKCILFHTIQSATAHAQTIIMQWLKSFLM